MGISVLPSLANGPAEAGDSDFSLSLDAFVRSIGVRRDTPHALFLGAGASISSGLPSAQSCIWEWKRDLFLTNNPGLEDQFLQMSLPSVRRRIQQWLDQQGGYPVEDSPDEYGFYIRHCFPIADDRRAFFQQKVRNAQPHIGYRLLAHLAQVDLVRSVWSTNFDGLPARAAATFSLTPVEVGIDTQNRIPHQPARHELLCVSLHGDYRYDELKNTPDELREQEQLLRAALIKEIGSYPLIVCGYSGRDRSIMEALRDAYAISGTGTLYWCGYSDGGIPAPVADLIAHARAHRRSAFYVPALGFDDLMARLALHCLEGERREDARKTISDFAPPDLLTRVPFQIAECPINTLIKSNAFEVECPSEVLAFDLKTWPKERVWTSLREQIGTRPLIAAPFKGKVLALGTIDGIKEAFGDNIKGPVERSPVSPDEFRFENGAIVGLMREALVRSMAATAKVATDERSEMWIEKSTQNVTQDGRQCHVHDSVLVFLRRIGGTQYVVLKPSLRVFDARGGEVSYETAGAVKLRLLGYQHNKPFNTAVNRWRELLFPKDRTPIFEYPLDVASTFKFKVRRSPVFGKIGLPRGGRPANIPASLTGLLKYKGLELGEPTLLLSNKAGTGTTKDTHPVRGIATNRPYDFPLTVNGLLPSLRIGVICPQAETRALCAYLQNANGTFRPGRSEADYLVDYPGFQTAYGLPIDIPTPGAAGWITCGEPHGFGGASGAISAAQQITTGIETLRSSFVPHVVLVFFPRRWDGLRSYRDENERFDVHDFVKAYGVQRGVATQFLTEDTLSDAQQCRVWWWLSLALYVKGMRTPWVLDGFDDDTAFVGLGFSIDRNAERGAHVVLGCSHIYSSRGEGLQYRLSKVEDPIIRGKNPFMSKEDARRTGETIRQLFFDARGKLPRRVVLHKRTQFLKEEREGLIDGLSGISSIDMLEIQEESAVRYVASVAKGDGSIDEDNYPVRRGTVMRIDDFTALLWVHGATTAVNPNHKYFQGKRRIPAPLTLRRHAGSTPLDQLGKEILGLSKMNWNTFDLYTKFPATLQSSGEIARIGALLQRFGAASYDYRLFI